MQHAQRMSLRAGPLVRLGQRRLCTVVTKFEAIAATRGGHVAARRVRATARKAALGAGAVGLLLFVHGDPVHCMDDGAEGNDAAPPVVDASAAADDVNEVKGSDEAIPDVLNSKYFQVGTRISFGAVAGYCSGYAIKKVGKAAVVFVGLSFIALQTLRYFGYINVDWNKVKGDIVKAVDTDGDGQVTQRDVAAHWKRLIAVLSFNIPGRAAFGMMVVLGFRHG